MSQSGDVLRLVESHGLKYILIEQPLCTSRHAMEWVYKQKNDDILELVAARSDKVLDRVTV